jgi:hypothetical protein
LKWFVLFYWWENMMQDVHSLRSWNCSKLWQFYFCNLYLCLHMLLLSWPKKCWARSFANVCTSPVGLMCGVFVIHLSTRVDTKIWMLWGRPQNEPCTSNFPIHTCWVVCGTSIPPDRDENDIESSYIFFKILLNCGYWNNKDDPAFQLLGSLL